MHTRKHSEAFPGDGYDKENFVAPKKQKQESSSHRKPSLQPSTSVFSPLVHLDIQNLIDKEIMNSFFLSSEEEEVSDEGKDSIQAISHDSNIEVIEQAIPSSVRLIDHSNMSHFCVIVDSHILIFQSRSLKLIKRVPHGFSAERPKYFHNVMTKSSRFFLIARNNSNFQHLYELNFKSYELEQKDKLIQKRINFAFIELNSKYLLSIGGILDLVRKSSCEAYNLNRGKWSYIAPLNVARSSHSAFAFNESIVYAYGGFGLQDDRLFEKITFSKSLKGSWEVLNVDIFDDFLPIQFTHSFVISSEEVLFFGGKDYSDSFVENSAVFQY